MSYSQTDLDNLKAAIAKGVTSVRMNGEEVRFRSLAEMLQTVSIIERSLGIARVSHYQPGFERGT